jgi:hypothetical protein
LVHSGQRQEGMEGSILEANRLLSLRRAKRSRRARTPKFHPTAVFVIANIQYNKCFIPQLQVCILFMSIQNANCQASTVH